MLRMGKEEERDGGSRHRGGQACLISDSPARKVMSRYRTPSCQRLTGWRSQHEGRRRVEQGRIRLRFDRNWKREVMRAINSIRGALQTYGIEVLLHPQAIATITAICNHGEMTITVSNYIATFGFERGWKPDEYRRSLIRSAFDDYRHQRIVRATPPRSTIVSEPDFTPDPTPPEDWAAMLLGEGGP